MRKIERVESKNYEKNLDIVGYDGLDVPIFNRLLKFDDSKGLVKFENEQDLIMSIEEELGRELKGDEVDKILKETNEFFWMSSDEE